MDLQNLEDRINGLKKVRDVCSSQLDIGALKELDGAIALLEELRAHPKGTAGAEARAVRVLQAIAAIVAITTNFRDWL